MLKIAPSHKRSRLAATVFAALAAAMLCCIALPAKANAAEVMAYSLNSSGEHVNYYTTDDAIQAGYSGKTIYLACDWNFTGTMNVADSKSLTIDMNGHKISASGGHTVIELKEHSSLTLKGTTKTKFEFYYQDKDATSTTKKQVESGGLVTGASGRHFGGGFEMDNYSTLTLDNVAVAGNMLEDCESGGGIYMRKNTTLNMKNGATIQYNKAWAGGIWIEKTDATINMDNSTICYNQTLGNHDGAGIYSNDNGTKIYLENHSSINNNKAYNGGGVFFNYTQFYIGSADKTGVVEENISTSSEGGSHGGGGIYVESKKTGTVDGTIKGLTIKRNDARSNGGGVVLNQKNTRIVDCTIQENSTAFKGGGVYVYNKNCSIENCTIEGNVCDNDGRDDTDAGGGVFVDSSYDIRLSGKMFIRNNTRHDEASADDLFLDTATLATSRAYITNGIDAGSSVGVRTDNAGDCRIGKDISTYTSGTYFADLPSFWVSHGTDSGGDLWQRAGAQTFNVNVNGASVGRYASGATTNISAVPEAGKAFWYWDASGATGLSPIEEYISTENMYDESLCIKMPGNDIELKAVLTDIATHATITVDRPEAGKELPAEATLTWAAGKGEMKIAISWLDENGSVITQADHGAKCCFVAEVPKNREAGLFFSSALQSGDIALKVSDGNEGPGVSESSVNEQGTLNLTSGLFETERPEIQLVESAQVSVAAGASSIELFNELPATANVKLSNGKRISLATDKGTSIKWPSGLVNYNGFVNEPADASTSYEIELPLAESGEVASVTGHTLTVKIVPVASTGVSAPVLSPIFASYNKYNTSPKLDGNLSLKVTAACTTEGATIKYKLFGSGTEYVYDKDTGLVLTGEEGKHIYRYVTFWAEKTAADGKTTLKSSEVFGVYELDDTMNTTIDIVCWDTALYNDGDTHWSDTFEVSGTVGSTVEIFAQTQENRVFDHWEWEGAPAGTDLTQRTLKIANYSKSLEGKIKAIYSPIVTGLDFEVAEPQAHSELPKNAKSVTAQTALGDVDISKYFASDGNGITITNLTPSTVRSDGTAEHDTVYSATFHLNPWESVAGSDGVNYAFADDLDLLVNGKSMRDKVNVADSDSGGEDLTITFAETSAYIPESLATPADAQISFADACQYLAGQEAGNYENWGLADEVLATYKCKETEMVDVEWGKLEGFNPENFSAQEFTLTGTVIYPEGTDTADAPKTVSAKVKVAAAEKVAAPKASVESGSYSSALEVELSCSTEDADIYYTTDGSEPTKASKQYGDEAISICRSATLKVRAYCENAAPSDVAEYRYTINGANVATPTSSLAEGTYATAQTFTLACATDGATIRYTMDGSKPTEESPAYSGETIGVDSNTRLRMRAFKDGMIASDIAEYMYKVGIQSVEAPRASVDSGTYKKVLSVELACDTEGAIIRYTTDGSNPTAQSAAYDGSPIKIYDTTLLKICAYKDGMYESPVMGYVYNVSVPQVETPLSDLESGTYNFDAQPHPYCNTDGVRIYYTLDGTEPTEKSAEYIDGQTTISIQETTTLKIRAFRDGMKPSDVGTYEYTIAYPQDETPVASVPSGTYAKTQTVELSCDTEGAIIRYTLDGTEPTVDSERYTGPLTISKTTTVKAKAFEGYNPSDVATFEYKIERETVATPTASDASGVYSQPFKVTLSCATGGATIRYTTDGTEPTEKSAEYTGVPFKFEEWGTTTTIKVRAFCDECIDSEVATFTYTLKRETLPEPSASPESGIYENPQKVTLSCSDPDVQIRYTVDGRQPSTTSTIYTGPLDISSSMTLKIMATKGSAISDVVTYDYNIVNAKVSTPYTPIQSGTYADPLNIHLFTLTEGATIRYTLDGTDPTAESQLYRGWPIKIAESTTLKVRAFCDEMADSDIATYEYVIGSEPAATYTVRFDSAGGSAVESQSIAEGLAADEPEAPTQAGFAFDYWATADGKQYNFATPVTADITLYAHWSVSGKSVTAHTVRFDTGEGSAVPSQSVAEGSTVAHPANPTLDGSTFEGWITDSGAAYDFATPVTSSFTLYAKWSAGGEDALSHLVTFDSAGGTDVDSQAIAAGGKVVEPAAPTLDGFTFDYWARADGSKHDFDSTVKSDFTLYAHWKANGGDQSTTAHLVTFDVAGGTSVDSQTVVDGGVVAQPATPRQEGFKFAYWATADGRQYDFATPVTADITLYAQWTADGKDSPANLVIFDSNGGSYVDAQTIAAGGLVTRPEDPTRDGYTFAGWTLDGEEYDFDAPVSGNITLVAQWNENPAPAPDPEPSPNPDGDNGNGNGQSAAKGDFAKTGDPAVSALAVIAIAALVGFGALAVAVLGSRHRKGCHRE